MASDNWYLLKMSPPGTGSIKRIMSVLCGTITNFNICLIIPSAFDFHYKNMMKDKPVENTLRLVHYKEIKNDTVLMNDDDFINKYKNTLFVSGDKSPHVDKFYEKVAEIINENEYKVIQLAYT